LSRPENDFQDKEMGATKVSPVIDKIQWVPIYILFWSMKLEGPIFANISHFNSPLLSSRADLQGDFRWIIFLIRPILWSWFLDDSF
jgi:hypothetical protein